ncbi:MAG: hypothetical protein KF842_00400 [Caulobacter sp.]|nr:hypothetical protein [Caulobacter sp.]
MSIIYVHGVKVRSPEHGLQLKKPFLRWLGPRIAVGAEAAEYIPVFWGDAAASFRWDLKSRPRTPFLRGGVGGFPNVGELRSLNLDALPQPQPAVGNGPVLGAGPVAGPVAGPGLETLEPERRADFLADMYLAMAPRAREADPLVDAPELAGIADAASAVAAEWDAIVAGAADDDERIARLLHAISNRLAGQLLAQGGFEDWMEKAGEKFKRAVNAPFDVFSTVAGELRPVAHEFVANFLGDVLIYQNERIGADGGPGEIPRRVLDALARAQARKDQTGEPIIVVTHSMGGQLLYDALTYFAARDARLASLKIDHWISCGAQVAFFAELGLFLDQPATRSPQKLPVPPSVSRWTNYYDINDLVGFIMAPVFDGVTDLSYDTGYGLALAHTGFLARPSFFEAMAKAVGKAP